MERKVVVYVAHPYRAEGDDAVTRNIESARRWARKFWALGLVALSPCTNSAHMDGPDIPEKMFLDGGLELLHRSDVLFLCPGWNHSDGCFAEKQLAEELGKRVYTDINELIESELMVRD